GCVLAQLLDQPDHRSPPGHVATARASVAEHRAGPSLTHPVSAAQEADRLAVRRRLHHFFETTALSAWLSKVKSATSCLSRRFSSSRAFSFFASLTSMPPNFAFQR